MPAHARLSEENQRCRAAEKEASRAHDEADMGSGAVPPGEMARRNGGGVTGVRRVGPCERIRRLAEE